MKNAYVIWYAITLAILFSCILIMKIRGKQVGHTLLKMIRTAQFTVLGGLVSLLSGSVNVANLGYAIQLCGMVWFAYFFFIFIIDLCGLKQNSYYSSSLVILVWLDTLAILLNPILKNVYMVREREFANELFYKYSFWGLGYCHLGLVILLGIFSVCYLVIAYRKSPKMFRKKYVVVFAFLVIGISLQFMYVYYDMVINMMFFLFAVGLCFLYYYAGDYISDALVRYVLMLTVTEMEDGLLIYDNKNRYIYGNTHAHDLLDEGDVDEQHFFEQFEKWCMEHELDPKKDFMYDRAFIGKKGEKKYLRIKYQILTDEEGCCVGKSIGVRDRTQEMELLKKEQYKANYDALTEIYNRDHFYEEMSSLIQENERTKFLLLCSDIKDFKLINELFGRKMGDEVLKCQADILKQLAGAKEVYGRITGDKFALCLQKECFNEQIFKENISKIEKKFTNQVYRMHIYIGIYEITDVYEPISVMVDKANMAIATIKGDYDKVFAHYDSKMLKESIREKRIVGEFEEALENGEFCMYLQPQCNSEGEVLGAEALVRWQKPGQDLIPPGEFLPVLEKVGMIYQLDAFIWEQAARQLKKWQDQGQDRLYISVNISVKDLYYMDIYKVLTGLIEKYEISPSKLKLEITETVLATEFVESINLIERLHQHGFTIEIDDFGSGYSSLNTLKDIHADIIKIDMGFLRETENKQRSKDILAMIIMLSKKLNMPVITEGVEKQEQLLLLTEMGCEMFQGYYFSKPIPVESFEEKYL